MAVTDQEVEANVIYRLLENGNADASPAPVTAITLTLSGGAHTYKFFNVWFPIGAGVSILGQSYTETVIINNIGAASILVQDNFGHSQVIPALTQANVSLVSTGDGVTLLQILIGAVNPADTVQMIAWSPFIQKTGTGINLIPFANQGFLGWGQDIGVTATIIPINPLLTTMFTVQQIFDSMNRVQQKFLLDTGIHCVRTTIGGVVGQGTYALPVDSTRPRRLTWTDSTDLKTRALTQVDTWELDQGFPDWPSDQAIPIVWWETTLPQQQVGLAKTPANNGTIGLLYVQLAATLAGTGVTLVVPDDWSPYILWGTLAELLSADGQSFDPLRAQYCRRRYEEGVELARLVLGGSWT